MSTSARYLVVVRERGDNASRRCYRGMDRLPPWPSPHQDEHSVLDKYVFGDLKDEDGFIPSLQMARKLLEAFGKSPMAYEIIRCDRVRLPELPPPTHSGLGFDVVAPTPFYSIVGDFPTEDAAVHHHAAQLNSNGLFDTPESASKYLADYVRHRLADYDAPYSVFLVSAVEP